MVHLPSLRDLSVPVATIIETSLVEASKLQDAGFNAILVENYADSPFAKHGINDMLYARMSTVLYALKQEIHIPVGVNILRNGCVQAMAMATALNLDFIRCNIWESAYITDQGIIEAAAFDVMECKTKWRSNVKVLADVFVKHATPLAVFTIVEAAENALERGKADAVIVSGTSTGKPPMVDDAKALADQGIKPFIGSGISENNVEAFAPYIQGAIVGTSIKEAGITTNPIDMARATELVELWKQNLE